MAKLTMDELKSWLIEHGFDLKMYPVRIIDDHTIAFTYSGESHFVRVRRDTEEIGLWWMDNKQRPFTAHDLQLVFN